MLNRLKYLLPAVARRAIFGYVHLEKQDMVGLNGDVLHSLREGRKAVIRQREKLNAALESFDNLIELFSEDSHVDAAQLTLLTQNLEVNQGPTDFVRSLLRAEPSKRWRAPEVVAALTVSPVNSSSNNVQANVASILNRLTEKGEIERKGKTRKHWYKWREAA